LVIEPLIQAVFKEIDERKKMETKRKTWTLKKEEN
jgi:hypothetical protein